MDAVGFLELCADIFTSEDVLSWVWDADAEIDGRSASWKVPAS